MFNNIMCVYKKLNKTYALYISNLKVNTFCKLKSQIIMDCNV